MRPILSSVAVLAVFGLVLGLALVPKPEASYSRVLDSDVYLVQSLRVGSSVVGSTIGRDLVSVTPGAQTLALGGTNADWAKLVLLFGEWPQSENNVTVIMRWMRQENGPPDWWNRNNPLNNGYGSGGGSGLGSYDGLTIAAQKAAENLKRMSIYSGIVASLAADASPDATAQAIWASPWASSHYGNGSHWSTSPVPIVTAPASAW